MPTEIVNEVKTSVAKTEVPYIKGIKFKLAERGKIKIGGLKDYSGPNKNIKFLPEKKDHFILTKMHRDSGGRLIIDEELMTKLKGAADKLTKLDVTMLYDDPAKNMPSFFAVYSGGYKACSGDGEKGLRRKNEMRKVDGKDVRVWLNEWEEITPCKNGGCEVFAQGKCKAHGILSVILSGVEEIGGVWRFRTTSETTLSYLYGGMFEVMLRTNGILAGLPLRLVLLPETVDTRVAGRQLVYRVSLVYPGTDESLRNVSLAIANNRAQTFANLRAIENLVPVMPIETREEALAITQEFYPDNVDTGVVETDEETQKEKQPADSEVKKEGERQKQESGTQQNAPVSDAKPITKGNKTTKAKPATGEKKEDLKTGENKPSGIKTSLF